MKLAPEIMLFADPAKLWLKNGGYLNFSTRPGRWTDLDVLDRLYTYNMRPQVERVGRWDSYMFRNSFEPGAMEVIEIAGKPAGFIKIIPADDSIYLAELQIAGPCQGRGLGSTILKRLIEYARGEEQLVTLKVLRGNPAEFFYRRYGFRVYKTTELHLHMSYYPETSLKVKQAGWQKSK